MRRVGIENRFGDPFPRSRVGLVFYWVSDENDRKCATSKLTRRVATCYFNMPKDIIKFYG